MDIISFSKAKRAQRKADNVQEQLNQAVQEGDQLVEVQQARVDEDGNSYETLKERLDNEQQNVINKLQSVNSHLMSTVNSQTALKQGTRDSSTSVSFVVDDGVENDLHKLHPIALEKQVPITMAVITDRVGTEGYLT